MSPFRFPIALLGFLGFVLVMPGWMWFLSEYAGNLSTEGQFLITMVLPATVALFLASWMQPGGV